MQPTLLPDHRTCWGMFCLCMATLMYELILTRIFSVLMWYHFASMAISLALFGMGVAALSVYLRPGWFPEQRVPFLAARFAALFGMSVALFFAIFVLFRLQPQFGFKVLAFFHQPFYQPFQQGFYDRGLPAELLIGLGGLYLITALPFFFSGLTVTLLLSRYLGGINRLYCWDLLGAGAGCLLIIGALQLLGGITAILAIALIGLLAAALLMPAGIARVHHAGLWVAMLLMVVAGAANLFTDFAEIRFVRGRYEPNLLWSQWNSFSRLAVYPTQAQEMDQGWGLSRTYRGPIPEQIGMVVDDTGYTSMFRRNDALTRDYFRANVLALPYTLHQQPNALIIGPGGGKDVLVALAMDARKVTAVEINPLIAEAVNQRFAAFTGSLYLDPRVQLEIDEGRSFIRRSQERYDLIQASAVFGRNAPAAGAFTLSENNLYTVEAFADYWEHLTPDGILTISRFIFERETLRLVSLGLKLLQQEGVADPAAHLAVIKERGLANFMLKRSPFTAEELAQLRETARAKEFDVVFLPDQRQGDGPFARLIAAAGSEAFYRDFPFDIRPTDDDRPFFYYMFKPVDFVRLLTFPEKSNFEDRAVLMLRNLLLLVSLFVALFLLLPLVLLRRRARPALGRGWRNLYFACLGLGFMLVEIGLMRRFVLFLGPPIYSLAIILCTVLVCSGLGALLAGRVAPGREGRALAVIILALVLLTGITILALPPLLQLGIAAPLPARCLLTAAILAPLGLLLGMPLPLGMRLFHPSSDEVPWSWGINSATSVLGTILAVIVAMNFGFNLTLLAGMAVYLLALAPVLAFGRLAEKLP